MVKRLRHRPFTAVTGVRIPLESLLIKHIVICRYTDVAHTAEQLIRSAGYRFKTRTLFLMKVFGPLAQLVRATGS